MEGKYDETPERKIPRKPVAAAADTPLPASPPKRMQGQMFDIVTGTLMLTLPLLICNITLISIIFLYRIPESSAETLSRGAVYLDISATLFTTIASWSSTVSPLLAGFMILLASYPAAAHMVRGYRESRAEALPTPYQFSMMLQYRAGAFFRVIVDTCVYLTSYKRVRAKFPPPLLIMSIAFCINTSLR